MSDKKVLSSVAKKHDFAFGEAKWEGSEGDFDVWLYWNPRGVSTQFQEACSEIFDLDGDRQRYSFINELRKWRRPDSTFPEVRIEGWDPAFHDKFRDLITDELRKTDGSQVVPREEAARLEAELQGIDRFIARLEERYRVLDELVQRVIKAWLWYAWNADRTPKSGSGECRRVDWLLADAKRTGPRTVDAYEKGNPVPVKRKYGPVAVAGSREVATLWVIIEEASAAYSTFVKGYADEFKDEGEREFLEGLFMAWEGLEDIARAQRQAMRFFISERVRIREARDLLEPRKQVAERALWSALTGEDFPTAEQFLAEVSKRAREAESLSRIHGNSKAMDQRPEIVRDYYAVKRHPDYEHSSTASIIDAILIDRGLDITDRRMRDYIAEDPAPDIKREERDRRVERLKKNLK